MCASSDPTMSCSCRQTPRDSSPGTTSISALSRNDSRSGDRGEVPFVSMRISPSFLIDIARGERTGMNVDHVAITVEDVNLDDLAASGTLTIEMGPADLFGARGVGRGLYLRDPDGNRVELRTYPAE